MTRRSSKDANHDAIAGRFRALGCMNCHAVVDGRMARPPGYTREDVRLAHAEGVFRTLLRRESA